EIVGINPDSLRNDMYFQRKLSITAGPFTGTLGTFRTIDDIAIAWSDSNGNDCVTIFKTKLNASKQFDGFEDGKLVLKDKAAANDKDGIGTIRGLVAVDMASEAVELGRPVHLKREGNRSYIAALSAIPYHVDTVDATGTALSEQPVNFTYSDASNGGNMTVQYGKSTTDTMTKNVQQDLSYSIETMFDVDPEAKGGSAFEKVKGVIGFASGIGRFVSAIQLGSLTTEQKRELVWQEEPGTPLDLVQGLMDAFTDRVDKIHQKASTDIVTTLIDKDITATTHDAILYTKATRHIWRYPVLTRPLPMWLASGPRIDYTQIENPGTVSGDKQLFVTFTMSENSELRTATSVTDSQYQPLHEEGNFFSYPSSVADVEGYNERGLLTKEVSSWTFSNTIDNSGVTFTEATSNMKHTETKVTPGPFTSMIRFF
ncbi:MAG: hypothetical protein IJP54_03470, partial [Synergistaceae bacterium]|nr:hypothetical protein [Synergistaceae bacterium]